MMKHLEALLAIIETETGINGNCRYEPDDDSVAWDGEGNPVPMTFGHIRRARAELEKLKGGPT